MEPLIFLFACAGATFFITNSDAGHIVRYPLIRFRLFFEMFQCAFCTGFWISLLLTVMVALLDRPEWSTLLMMPFAGAMAAYLFDRMAAGSEANITMTAMLSAPEAADDVDEG